LALEPEGGFIKEVETTGAELKAIREGYGPSASAMGRVLGYSGPKANIAIHIRGLERDARRIPPSVEKLDERQTGGRRRAVALDGALLFSSSDLREHLVVRS
jgi:hypothetical protein